MIKYIKMTETAKDLTRGSEGAAGFDICADEDRFIQPNTWEAIKTGIGLEFSDQVVCRVCPRSGLAVRNGINVLAGVVDSDYRGNITVVLMNHGSMPFHVNSGDRIAQLIFSPVLTCVTEWTGTVSETERGANGFGSTGV